MAALYSKQLIACPIGGTAMYTYTVPSGKVTVVRDITIRLTTTGPVYVVDVENPELALAVVASVDSITGVAHLEGRWVLNAGQILRAYDTTATGHGSALVSGYELTA